MVRWWNGPTACRACRQDKASSPHTGQTGTRALLRTLGTRLAVRRFRYMFRDRFLPGPPSFTFCGHSVCPGIFRPL
jgi:hypothetical protein